MNDHGAIYSSINGNSDPGPMLEVDNSSRVIKYVALLGYRYSGYSMPGLRIHDITLIADLNAHDPTVVNPCDVELDGTIEGSVTSDVKDTLDSDTYDIASQQVTGEWGIEFWPLYNLYVYASASVLLLHITIDLLSNVQLLSVNIIEHFLNNFGIEFVELDYLFETLISVTSSAVFATAVFTMEIMTAALMLYSATQSLPALSIGIALWFTTVGLVHVAATTFAEELDRPTLAGILWFLIAIQAFCNLVGGVVAAGYNDYMRKFTKILAGFIEKLGASVSWSGSRLTFGWAPKIALAFIIGLGVVRWLQYGQS